MANASHLREKILTFIKDFRERKGYAPTVREIAQGCGVTTPSVVQYHLNQLERAGLISREKEKFRSISLTGHRGLPVQVPVLGTIAAGHPIWVPSADMWSATAARLIEVPSEITQGRKDLYALEVRGNSMVDAMIADGDIVIMEPVSSIKNGDVAACWLKNEQEVTLKKVYCEDDRVRLQPCNPYMMPFYHDATNVEIKGKVVAVIRIHHAG